MSKWDKICENCEELNLSDSSRWIVTKYYCEYYRTYQYLDDKACNHFQNRYGWYISTAFCKIMGYEENFHILTELQNMRDIHMINNPKYEEFLNEYQEVGPIIAEKLENDVSKNIIASIMNDTYIQPMMSLIKEKKYESASNLYVLMTHELKNFFGIKKENNKQKQKTLIRF